MAGTYIIGQHKDLSGVYTKIMDVIDSMEAGERGIVAYPFTADWGPVNELRESYFDLDFRDLYNAENTNFTANKIFDHAFRAKPYLVLRSTADGSPYAMKVARTVKARYKPRDREG